MGDQLQMDYDVWRRTNKPDDLFKVVSAFDDTIRGTAYKVGGDDNTYHALRAHVAQNMGGYDRTKGDLPQYVNQVLRRAPRISAQAGAATHVPEKAQRDISILRKAEEQWTDDRGEPPTSQELAEYTSIPVRRQVKLMRQYRNAPVLMSSLSADQLPALDDDRLSPEQQAWVEFTVSSLNKRDRLIYDHLSAGTKTPAQLSQAMGVSQSAISQRVRHINTLLDEVDFG